ncbi:hypothetical protein [Micromonospora sp. NBC_01796]|uniref:hypothetical protein n=1 Tax=Micromonospora sp. NBC_01796 TaxID=2975987 RepID=UPI002DD9532D|nr:hypothetical protein [Micromonospora sp. NBC_01796]WSA88075.1 hypothetical protein OIE47_10950 [Micromonospora sp. NBC_01796]
MTDPTPTTPDATKPAPRKTTPAKPATTRTTPTPDAKPATRKAAAKKTAEPKLYNPTVTTTGRLDHSTCGHTRDLKGRAACRAEAAKADKK